MHPSSGTSGNEFPRTATSRASETSWRGASRPASCVARRDRQERACLPVRARSYGNWFRDIARAAGIPDAVLEYGSRRRCHRGREAGAALEAIQGALTHTNKVTTLRYLRGRRTKKLSEIAEARNSKRAADNDGGTASEPPVKISRKMSELQVGKSMS